MSNPCLHNAVCMRCGQCIGHYRRMRGCLRVSHTPEHKGVAAKKRVYNPVLLQNPTGPKHPIKLLVPDSCLQMQVLKSRRKSLHMLAPQCGCH